MNQPSSVRSPSAQTPRNTRLSPRNPALIWPSFHPCCCSCHTATTSCCPRAKSSTRPKRVLMSLLGRERRRFAPLGASWGLGPGGQGLAQLVGAGRDDVGLAQVGGGERAGRDGDDAQAVGAGAGDVVGG